MYYREAEEEFIKILEEEKITYNTNFLHVFLDVLSEICNYTEEDHKIRPKIIFGKNMHNIMQLVNSKSIFLMKEDDFEGTHFLRVFKSLALFCDNGWYIYININSEKDKIEYGIFRMYTNIDGIGFKEYIQENLDDFSFIDDSSLITIETLNNFTIAINRPKKEDVIISLKFVNADIKGVDDYEIMSKDIMSVSNIDGSDISDEMCFLQRAMLKVLKNLPIMVHGTIILVVEDEFKYPNQFLSGIEINPPIDFYKHFLENKIVSSYADAEKFYAITGAFYEMLNNDGITIITKSGKVIGYNAFYEGEIPKDIKGGARKRTAVGIYGNENIEQLCAVYFQSQDGEIKYRRR